MAKKETVILEFEADSNDAIVSIEKLTKANKELREERKKVDLSTDEGVKRVKAINEQLDKNNEIIKNNSSTLEKNRLNVGNYTESIKAAAPALDKFTGGLYSASQGFVEMAKGALAFIATPIGAVIGALGLAIGALTAYFKGSEEGQDNLTKITSIAKVVWGGFLQVIETVGGAIFKAGEFIAGVGKNILQVFVPGIGAGVNAAVEAGKKIAELDDEIGAKENELITKRAQVNLEVAKLRERALSLEGDAKRKVIQEAIDLERQLAEEETAQAERKLALIEEDIRITGEATEEQKTQRADAQADILNKQAEAYQATLRFQKELEKLDEEHKKKLIQQREAKDLADFQAEQRRLNQQKDYLNNRVDNEIKAGDNTIKVLSTVGAGMEQTFAGIHEKLKKDQEAFLTERAQQWADNVQQIAGVVQQNLNGLSAITDQYYENQEAKLELSLANQKAQLQADYAAELAILDEKFAKGEISQEQYNADVFALNEKLKADEKAAQIQQAQELNEIKRKQFVTDKIKTLADIAIQTALGIAKAVAASPLTGGLPWSAAVGIVGAAQAALVAAQKFVPETFRTGGYTGDGDPDQIAGAVHKSEFVMPAETVAKYGKDHFQAYMDGTIVAGSMTGGMQGGGASQAPVYLNYTEFRKFVKEVEMKEKLVTA